MTKYKNKIKTFITNKWNNEKIYIFGAGKDGKIIAQQLEKEGIQEYIFIDRNSDLFCKCVTLNEVEKNSNYNILLASSKYIQEIYNEIISYYDDYNIYTCEDLYIKSIGNVFNHSLHEIYSYFSYSNACVHFLSQIENGWFLPHLDVVVTEKCTLRCEGCCNLVPYYSNPTDMQLDDCIEAMDNLLNSGCFLETLNFIGGEPLINQNMIIAFLERYKSSRQIGTFQIITNGTLMPSKLLAASVPKTKFYFIFSNYEEKSIKQNEAVKMLEDEGILVAVEQKEDITFEDNTLWIDYGEVKDYGYSDVHVKEMYDKCVDGKTCTTLINGKIFVCSRIANAINMNKIPLTLDGNYIDLRNLAHEYVSNELKYKCISLISQEMFPGGCKYCNKLEGKQIERGKQIEAIRK